MDADTDLGRDAPTAALVAVLLAAVALIALGGLGVVSRAFVREAMTAGAWIALALGAVVWAVARRR